MKCIQMTKVDDSKILTPSVIKLLTKQVKKEFDNAEVCVTKVRKKSIDTVNVWQLIKNNDQTYHIAYILLGYKQMWNDWRSNTKFSQNFGVAWSATTKWSRHSKILFSWGMQIKNKIAF